MTAFRAPPEIERLLARITALTSDGVYVVGGTVRDVLLGRPARDLDIAVAGDAQALARALADALAGHYVPLDGARGIARVVLDGGDVRYIDVARMQGDSLAADLRGRDFTIDAMAVRAGDTAVIDPTGGLADLAARLVRMISVEALEADPQRMLRAVRIAGELGFDIEPATEAAIRALAPRVLEAAAERRRDELARIFELENTYPSLRRLDALGLLDALLPEVTFGRGVAQPENWHAYDVFDHNMHAVEAIDVMLAPLRPLAAVAAQWMWDGLWTTIGWCEDPLRAYLAEELSEGRSRASMLKIAALLHDVAKPQTKKIDADGRMRFFGHADEGAAIAGRIMRRLRFSARECTFVQTLVAEHLRPVQLAPAGEPPTRRALYRFVRDVDDAVPAVLLLALADAAAARGPKMTPEGWARQAGYMNSLLVRFRGDEGIVDAPRLLTGRDIMIEFALPQGPRIGELLEALREAQAVGELPKDRESALAFVRARLTQAT